MSVTRGIRAVAAADLAVGTSAHSLRSETLFQVVGTLASSPDLDRLLGSVVDLLTEATDCHGCFVYLRGG
jgi:hypothetical protein